jgi:hypothetical protein
MRKPRKRRVREEAFCEEMRLDAPLAWVRWGHEGRPGQIQKRLPYRSLCRLTILTSFGFPNDAKDVEIDGSAGR